MWSNEHIEGRSGPLQCRTPTWNTDAQVLDMLAREPRWNHPEQNLRHAKVAEHSGEDRTTVAKAISIQRRRPILYAFVAVTQDWKKPGKGAGLPIEQARTT